MLNMSTVQTNIRLDIELRKWYDDKGKEEDRDASYFMKKALVNFRDQCESFSEEAVSKKEIAKPKTKRFTKPTYEEAAAYFYERGSQTCHDDATQFIDFYESKGWLVGKSAMKCWKAAIRNWMKKRTNIVIKKKK